MNAFDKFQRLNVNTKGLFPGQDALKNHILNKADVIYVDDVNDYSVLESHKGSKFVWLVDKSINIYPSFPWYYSPEEKCIYKFPYVYKESRKVKTYDLVQLVPADAHKNKYDVVEEKYICGHYDPYKGKDLFDIFYIGEDKTVLRNLEERGFIVQVVENFAQARAQSFTDMFWVVYDDTEIRETFKFSYKPDEWSFEYPHVFGNGDIDKFDGICLCPKDYDVTSNELNYRFFVKKKEIRIMASNPRQYDKFIINTYEQYQEALKASTTEMFWGIPNTVILDDNFKFDYYISHDSADRKSNHVWLNGNKYDGVVLFSKDCVVSEKEIKYKFLANRIEHEEVASYPKDFERFTIDNYEQYKRALENCGTDMFWAVPSDVEIDEDFEWDEYFKKQQTLDKKITHIFLNGDHYDGVRLMSVHSPVSEKELTHRFFTDKKEHEVLASRPKPYDIFTINTYEDYTHALYNTTSEMFWGVPSDVEVKDDFDFNLYFSYHNQYDRNINHVFLNKDEYDGIVLFSKNLLVSEKEVEHRFYIKKKEWDIVASIPRQYPIYKVNDYQDYLKAKEDSYTDLFWITNDDIVVMEDFDWNFYISHHNQYERKINHVWKNGNFYDGVALTTKHINISQREIDYRFFAIKKEYDNVASMPKPYDIVFISNGEPNADENYHALKERFPRTKRVQNIKGIHEAHKRAAELVDTYMFWVVDADAEILEDFNFDYYVPRYDIDGRETVHVWRSFNPVNGLVYGYGGVKLLPTSLTRNVDVNSADMTTSISDKFKGIDKMSNTTAFNTDAFSAWRSGFRECAKLASRTIARQKDDETEFRLNAWCTRGEDKPFGKAAIAGAKAGKEFGELNKDDAQELLKINDFEWLKKEFKRLYQQV